MNGKDYARITWEIGNRTQTAWAETITVKRDAIEFMALQTGHTRVISHATPWTITEGVELPPKVKEAIGGEIIDE